MGVDNPETKEMLARMREQELKLLRRSSSSGSEGYSVLCGWSSARGTGTRGRDIE